MYLWVWWDVIWTTSIHPHLCFVSVMLSCSLVATAVHTECSQYLPKLSNSADTISTRASLPYLPLILRYRKLILVYVILVTQSFCWHVLPHVELFYCPGNIYQLAQWGSIYQAALTWFVFSQGSPCRKATVKEREIPHAVLPVPCCFCELSWHLQLSARDSKIRSTSHYCHKKAYIYIRLLPGLALDYGLFWSLIYYDPLFPGP